MPHTSSLDQAWRTLTAHGGTWHTAGFTLLATWIAFALAPASLTALFVALGVATAAWLLPLALHHRRSAVPDAAALWPWAVAVRVAGLFYIPWLEDDWYRYLWDGWRLLQDGTPYGVAPAEYFLDTTIPSAFVDILSGINHPEMETIYGPSLEYLFGLAALIQPASLWPLKLFLLIADLALIALIGRIASPVVQWAYALCPLVVLEIGFHAHPDGLGALLILAAILLAARPAWRGGLVALACGVKPWAILVAPWLLRTRWAAAGFVATLMLLYGPFLANGSAGLDVLAEFSGNWAFNSPLYQAISTASGEPHFARAVLTAAGIGLWCALAWWTRHAANPPLELIFGGVLLLSPVVNPWYWLWVLPFAGPRRLATPWVAAIVLPLSYAHGLFVDSPGLGPYQVMPAMLTLEWTVITLALIRDAWHACRHVNRPDQ